MASTEKHLDCPPNCPLEIYTIMKKWWRVNPPDRLAANEIVRDIRNISLGRPALVIIVAGDNNNSNE